ncbi:LytR/AlgR family response regulator transcription factor [Flavobacterium caeni]|uniref:Two component transcriptional regulator, LytTR family n=1 Tax=Flavobacterium caeni TaxID=490189 RepID=A0A1G5B184_9FLAO|nr:LytTR family DNA-binding domain-containing protein [Flavobacterium caeni]SCX83850.1 two component transcriptional regulator, LytTR family [Flavobacterium caeni]
MNCIIIDDEPLAREAIQMLVEQTPTLRLMGSFNSPMAAQEILGAGKVDLIFLDIQMPGTNGIAFARTIPGDAFVVFTTAFPEFAIDSYEVDAIDYLIKPVKLERFQRAVEKAQTYAQLLKADHAASRIADITEDHFFLKADRKIFKIYFSNILYIEGLKDYVVVHTQNQKIITAMNIKTIHDRLPKQLFARVSKSYIVNVDKMESVDNNTVYIGKNEIPIGNIYRDAFFGEFVSKKIISR